MNELPITETLVNVNGVTLWTATQGEGFPFVLCHGGPGGYDDMEPLSVALAHTATLHRYDQRGCGRSSQTPPYTLETYLQDLDGLRQYWGHSSWIVAGHSWGAGLALAYAIRYPERVRALVYISGTGVKGGWGEEYRKNRWSRLTPEEQQRWLWLRRRLKGGEALDPQEKRELDQEYTRLYRYTDFADRGKVLSVPEQAPAINHEVNALLNAEWERYLAALTPTALTNLTMPTLIVHGQEDPRPSRMARELADMLPNATYVELPGSGHYPYWENPGQLAAVIHRHLIDCGV